MLMAELSTAVLHKLNVKVMVLNNDALAQVKFEQQEIGSQEYGCALGHIDFAAFAESCGAKGFRVSGVRDLKSPEGECFVYSIPRPAGSSFPGAQV